MLNGKAVAYANKKHFDKIANKYEKETDLAGRSLFGKNAQRRIEGVITSIARGTSHKMLLDIGCGTGNVLKFSKNNFDVSMGLDISFAMLQNAEKHSQHLVNGDSCFLPFKRNCFDAVTCVSVVHHVFDLKSLMDEIYRVLKKDGIFYSDHDPNRNYFKLTKKSALFCLIRDLVFKIFGVFRKRMDNAVVKDLVEYHWSIEEGINAEGFRKMLESIGFGQVEIIFHSDSASIEHPRRGPVSEKAKELLAMMLCLERRYENICRLFSVIARK